VAVAERAGEFYLMDDDDLKGSLQVRGGSVKGGGSDLWVFGLRGISFRRFGKMLLLFFRGVLMT